MALKRLAQRWKQRTEGSKQLSEEDLRACDGRPDLYDAQSAVREAWDSGAEPYTKYLVATKPRC